VNPLANAATALILINLAITLGYTMACWVDPFPKCRACTGSGRKRTRFGRDWRNCRRCRGAGRRLRAGRRAANSVRQLRRDANRI
jgi:DnaJ-class molecular chaperone